MTVWLLIAVKKSLRKVTEVKSAVVDSGEIRAEL